MMTVCRLFLEQRKALKIFCLFPVKILMGLLVFLDGKLTATNYSKAREECICVRIDPRIGPFSVQVVVLWVIRKLDKKFDLPMTDSQEVLFWYERTTISLQT